MAARSPDKPVLQAPAHAHGARPNRRDPAETAEVSSLFGQVMRFLGTPRLVAHNIDAWVPRIFRKGITVADPRQATLRNAAFGVFLVGQQAAGAMLANTPDADGAGSTFISANAGATLKDYPTNGALAMVWQAKAGLAQSMARELMPRGIHGLGLPKDAAEGWRQDDGGRARRLAGTAMAGADRIAEVYLQLRRQHRANWTCEIVLWL